MLQTELSAVLSPSWQPPVPEPAVDLTELLVPGSWEFCVDPFPHVRAERVFTATNDERIQVQSLDVFLYFMRAILCFTFCVHLLERIRAR